MSASGQAGRPNVIVFFTDQQRWDTAGCYGSPMDLTPNLDRMAARGTCFQRAFTCQPVCAPARASLQTGRYAAATTVFRNGVPLPPAETTLAHCFKQAGYRVGYIGKWHLSAGGDRPVPAELRGGYDYWLASDALECTSHPYEGHLFDENDRPVEFSGCYRSDFLTDKAIEYIDACAGDPFFLFLSFIEPHQQNDMKRLIAPDGYAERYANCFVPADLRVLPGDWMRELPDYYGMCARLDENLGRLLGHLESRSLTQRSVVLFTSDHGCHFRTRNGEYKRSCHESSVRIPMVFQGGVFDGHGDIPELVSLVDVPATLLAAAALPVPAAGHGRSMLRLLARSSDDWPEEVFLQISEAEVGRAIRTDRWKYSVFAPERSGTKDASSETYVERYLYDLQADPAELVNLVGRPRYADVAEQLRARLIARMVAAGEQAPTILPARYYA